MVDTRTTVWLARVSENRPESTSAFPLPRWSQNGPRPQGFASPRLNGAPLTAPGRSEERFLPRGKGREYKPAAASASRWSALTTLRPGAEIRKILPGSQPTRIPGRSRPRIITSQRTGQKRVGGAECRDSILGALQLEGEVFSLDIPSYRTSGGKENRSGARRFGKALRVNSPTPGVT